MKLTFKARHRHPVPSVSSPALQRCLLDARVLTDVYQELTHFFWFAAWGCMMKPEANHEKPDRLILSTHVPV